MIYTRKISNYWTVEEMRSRIFKTTHIIFKILSVRKIMKKMG